MTDQKATISPAEAARLLDEARETLGTLNRSSAQVAQLVAQLEALGLVAEQRTTSAERVAEEARPPERIAEAAGDVPTAMPLSGPLTLMRASDPAEQQQLDLAPNGLSPDGEPLLRIDTRTAASLALGNPDPKALSQTLRAKNNTVSGDHLGTIADVNPDDLRQARWAIVVSANDDAALLKALSPLIAHRSQQQGITLPPLTFKAGETCGAWHARSVDLSLPWEKRPPVLLYLPEERPSDWLRRYGTSHGPVDPKKGVPYYLLMAGRPGPLSPLDSAYIPFAFQYEIDIFWAVGRLCFSEPDGQHRLADYTAYAEQLVAVEQRTAAAAAKRLSKEVVYFGTRHASDRSTERSADELITPLVGWHSAASSLPQQQGFAQRTLLGAEASRTNLGGVLTSAKPPAILFSATHGVGFPLGDARLVSHQGALVCSEWEGFGKIKPEHWLAGEDAAALGANVEGMVALIFACYGAGAPQHDEFIFDEQRRRPVIAPFPLIAQLPQQLLVRGCLGVLGHVERAWSYSFSGTAGGNAQVQGFQDVLGRLMSGRRAGDATDQFNVIQAARSAELVAELEYIKFGKKLNEPLLATLWMARNDARNYVLLGDPAVKLPFPPAKVAR
jgi:hypothetical protein